MEVVELVSKRCRKAVMLQQEFTILVNGHIELMPPSKDMSLFNLLT